MKFTIGFPGIGLGFKLNCNNEAAFSPDHLGQLWSCILLLLSGQSHAPAELEFIKHWTESGILPESLKEAWPRKATEFPDSAIPREFTSALRLLRAKCPESSSRATAYKHLFAAALSSERNTEKLMSLISAARDILELETTVASLIADGIEAEHPACPHSPGYLTHDEREAILAMTMIAVNADEQKHVLELTALRIVMLALNITSVDNIRLAAMAKQGIPDLAASLSAMALPTALLNLLRIIVADHNLHQRERQAIAAISNRMSGKETKAIRNAIMLESGIGFEI